MYVKIHKDRGYGDTVWKVVSKTEREYKLKDNEGKEVTIYKAHCSPASVKEIRETFGWPPK